MAQRRSLVLDNPVPAAETGPGELLRQAADGDQAAWHALVQRYGRVVWAVARGHGLNAADAADVSQMTWLRLFQSLGSIRDPERLSGWLSTTAHREALRLLTSGRREVTSWDDAHADRADPDGTDPDGHLITAERDAVLWHAFGCLPVKHQQVLRLLIGEHELSYGEVSRVLGMPVGSIGPTRARSLQHLRGMLAGTDVFDGLSRGSHPPGQPGDTADHADLSA